MKVLFIVPYPSEGASNRFRVEQYLPHLDSKGISYDIRPFFDTRFYKILYLKNNYIKKIVYFLKAVWRRIEDILRLHNYDLIFIHREACPLGPPIFEWLIYKTKKPIVFDFDDAIFLPNFNTVNRIYSFLKFPSKTKRITKMSSVVIVSNAFLEQYASKFNQHVHVIPTPVDVTKFVATKKDSKQITIGWIGSFTTSLYLPIIFNVMQELGRKYDFIFKIIGAEKPIFIPGVKVENREWSLEKEVQNFQDIDIGIYPLPDTLWTQGKGAFKAIQYMSVAVPVVSSPVGMNRGLIQDGINGFLASSDEEWVEKISRLIEDPGLRHKIGLAGRRTIEEKFSVKVNAPRFLKILTNNSTKRKL
ncbi:glycosyltransferase family 4 protein [Candidatus Omnitrophota bacterium]